jgi:uncharacterized protein YndB with AHSA1/START domain
VAKADDQRVDWPLAHAERLRAGRRQASSKRNRWGKWDGIVHCQVLEVKLRERLVYNWTGGSDDNAAYGSPLDTVVTWTLTPVEGGTRLRLVHSGFRSPENDFAFNAMSGVGVKSCERSGGLPASASGDRDRA